MMKIKHVHIDGFGKWHDQDFDLTDNPTLIYGHNEAGKTTLANFILSVLFGFADGRGKNRYLQYQPKNGSSYGGSLTVDHQGQTYRIQRVKGTGGGKVTITDVNGHRKPADFLRELVGPLDRELYRAIYSFGNRDIISEDLSKEEVNAQLQQVGAVGSRQWLTRMADLNKAADAIYKPRGRKQPLGQHLRAYDDLVAQVNAARSQSADYQRLQQSIHQLTTEQEHLKTAHPQLQKQVTSLERLQRLWPVYEQWQASQRQDQLVTNLSDEEVTKIQSLQTRIAELQNQLQNCQQEATRLAAQTEGLDQPELADYRSHKADYQQLKDQLLALQMQDNTQLNQQGEQWQTEQAQLVQRYHSDHLPAPLSDAALVELQSLQAHQQGRTNYAPWVLVDVGVLLLFIGLGMRQGLMTILGIILALAGGGWWYWNRQQNTQRSQQALTDFGRQHHLTAFPMEQWSTMQNDCHRYQDLSEQLAQLKQSQDHQVAQLAKIRESLPTAISGTTVAEISADYNRWLTMMADRAAQLNQLQREESANTAQLKRLKDQLTALNQEKASYYQRIQITTDDEFSHYLQARTAAQSQQITRQAYDQQLTSSDKQALGQYSTAAELGQAVTTAHQELAENSQSQERVTGQLADLRIQVQHLVRDGSYSELQQRLANLQSQLWSETQDWLSHLLAIKWIEQALQLASANRFPQIISQASRFFQTLTNGHYVKVQFDDQGLAAITNDGTSFAVEELSLGTEEQLFIALRLGFIMVIADQIQLPILIDDGFVNFDAIRRERMLSLLEQLASHQQVIYFTADERIKQSDQPVLDLNQYE